MVRVRFFKNREGRRLAYSIEGEGPLLLWPPWWVSHLERDAESPAFARFFGQLAEHFRVVRLDRLGVGLSDRQRSVFTLASEVADVEALHDEVGGGAANLFGMSCGVPVALALAARRPKAIKRLLLCGGFIDGARLAPPAAIPALAGLVRAHWGMGSRALGDLFHPGAEKATLRQFSRLQRDATSAETAARLLELTFALDASAFLARVRPPVLVLHRRDDSVVPYEHGRELAARLPGASLVSFDGREHLPWEGDSGPLLDAALSFLQGAAAPDHSAPAGQELRRDGEVWTVRFGGRRSLLRDCKGLADLARLLAQPGRELHALDLFGGAVEERRDGARADPLLDQRALQSYRKRIRELDAALAEAEGNGDQSSFERLSGEREALLAGLAAATGPGGRRRRLDDPVERARKAIAARLRDAIRRAAVADPQLGRHLAASIQTGIRCSYQPQPPMQWRVAD